MFKIDMANNEITKLPKQTFRENGIQEVQHLQEWIAKNPACLGEDLLIIQKEFDGFDGTYERLDLLALDKKRKLVIIENKLDDSGRDVVWQALKYAAYCSSLTRADIVEMFQQYLDKGSEGKDARQELLSFFDVENIEELKLNTGPDQRIILVAANFRKEVTSTALWLGENNLSVQCFKATPYAVDENLLLDISQIIPPPDVQDYMIGIRKKDEEQKQDKKATTLWHNQCKAFWKETLNVFEEDKASYFQNFKLKKVNSIGIDSGISSCRYYLVFCKTELRVEYYLAKSDAEENKKIYDYIIDNKSDIEIAFGDKLIWERLDSNTPCRISYRLGVDSENKDNWSKMIEWLAEHFVKLEKSMNPILSAYKDK